MEASNTAVAAPARALPLKEPRGQKNLLLRLFKSKGATAGLVTLVLLAVIALTAPIISPASTAGKMYCTEIAR